ncbi:hypothetical protein DPMN_053581 [Dreissena polymorpha]|uniref:Uncharacterized protein n=1 Tax=Dreissena polymorpha TaxID=45954 RepID=A0A9D4CNC4_DREPO|nr:hypothetical protein DPMN_053581 [Dreissena polymorpha]
MHTVGYGHESTVRDMTPAAVLPMHTVGYGHEFTVSDMTPAAVQAYLCTQLAMAMSPLSVT